MEGNKIAKYGANKCKSLFRRFRLNVAIFINDLKHAFMFLFGARNLSVKIGSKLYRLFRGVVHRCEAVDQLPEILKILVLFPFHSRPFGESRLEFAKLWKICICIIYCFFSITLLTLVISYNMINLEKEPRFLVHELLQLAIRVDTRNCRLSHWYGRILRDCVEGCCHSVLPLI